MNLHPQRIAFACCHDADEHWIGIALDAVLVRVLDERLQEHRGRRDVQRIRCDIPAHDGALAESLVHDVGVLSQHLQLFLQRNKIAA